MHVDGVFFKTQNASVCERYHCKCLVDLVEGHVSQCHTRIRYSLIDEKTSEAYSYIHTYIYTYIHKKMHTYVFFAKKYMYVFDSELIMPETF